MSDDTPTVTGLQAAKAQTALRGVLGLPPEQFSVPAFIGMVSDEIEQLRAQGKTDYEISLVIEHAIDVRLPSDAITLFYAPPEERKHPHP